ncbi:Zn-dependent hydrolase [Paracoccus sp. S-4012]|uniref:Zn-dependent hydrolase n=1 Tax=Paracoccus sp. S-4012 TaxID=2665648 RepID=UPI0012AF0128|nr:Zn-dependent hydrolase [Paracoccus sp. S-4012]MRX51740.1 Zn-dependent hydrolase [Paracoccus sp. S-4012]
MRNTRVNPDRIAADLEALARITDPGRPWTRSAFSPRFDEGRRWLTDAFTRAGLEVALDPGGNLIGTRSGSDPAAATIMLGSHSDTVPDGGRFDGPAGVIAALEVARMLDERGIRLRHGLAVVDFLAEEVSPFGVSCIGSRSMAGLLPEAWLELQHDGRSLGQAMRDVGGNPAAIAARGGIKAFLELHIEQGTVLESSGTDAGLVTTVAGITRIEVVLTGRPDHAGTVPMGARADALVAAAALITDIDAAATARAAQRHFTATVGEFSIEPGAANVVPSRARLLIDARAAERPEMEDFAGWLDARLAALPTGIMAETRRLSDNMPTAMDAGLVAELEGAADRIGASRRRMVSGAGHDAAWIARIAPAAMVFVPCLGGRSHCPEEWAETADIALGAELLAEAVIALDRE